MKWIRAILLLAAAAGAPAAAPAQGRRNEADFVKQKPAVGEVIPDVTVYDSAGRELKTSSLRGHYTVLTFGCLT